MTDLRNSPEPSSAHENRFFLFGVDDSLRIKYVSPSIRAICGFSPDELRGKPLLWLLPGNDSGTGPESKIRALIGNRFQDCRFETICRHKNGSRIPVEVLARAGNNVGEIHACALDLSDHRELETRLRLSDGILNTINSMVLVANGEGQIIYTSPSVTKMLGYSSAEVLGYGWWLRTISDNDVRRLSAERIASCARGKMPPRAETWEEQLLDVNGEAHWILWQDAKGPDDLFIGVGQEITERKAMEDALAESAQQVQAIFASALEGLLILNEDLIYVDANPAACELLGRPRDEVIGKQIGAFSSNPERALAQFSHVLTDQLPLVEGEIRIPDGSMRNLEYSLRPNFLPGRHLVVTRNVTERKRLESQLLQAQKMEAIGQLAGGVAHDFNNMLTVIRGYTELLQRRLNPESDLRRYADTILSATDKATMTTQQLLAFSRQQVVQPRELNVNFLIQEMGKLLHRLIGEDVQVRFDLATNLGTVKLDPGQINQILLNLAVNARDAMPDGGTLRIETANATLDRSYSSTHLKVDPGEYVMLTVTDSGCGMSPEIIARIFEPFFTTKPPGKGTGLGLATVYGIVEQAHGAIYVYSEPGEGTSFKLYFPRIDTKAAEEPFAASACSGAVVLVIDDDEKTRRLTCDFLRERGYRVYGAQGGGEALRLCQSMTGELELIISDITMPGADGQDIQGYLAIRHPKTRMIYISGFSKMTLRERGILPPEAEFLQKPFRMEELLLRMEEVLAR